MKTEKIVCDHCGRDLTETDEMPDYRVVLDSEAMPHNSPIVCSVLVEPPVRGLKHFCGLGCLKYWVGQKA